jgi:hypothetical protein
MYSDLVNLLKEKEYFKEVEINTINKGCCEGKTPLLDLNEIKTTFYKLIKATCPKTVHALLFSDGNKLHLIQAENYLNAFADVDNLYKALTEGHLTEKINGSIKSLSDIVNHYGVSTDFNTFFGLSKREKVTTYVLVFINQENYQNFVRLRLGTLGNLNIQTEDPILGEIKLISCSDFEELFGEKAA